ncbi:MAG: KUP/HAK/KT family potassium transporter, partial [Phycisphaerales bacterium]
MQHVRVLDEADQRERRLWAEVIPRVPGTAVFMTPSAQAPFALVSFVKLAHVLHEQVILLS